MSSDIKFLLIYCFLEYIPEMYYSVTRRAWRGHSVDEHILWTKERIKNLRTHYLLKLNFCSKNVNKYIKIYNSDGESLHFCTCNLLKRKKEHSMDIFSSWAFTRSQTRLELGFFYEIFVTGKYFNCYLLSLFNVRYMCDKYGCVDLQYRQRENADIAY